MVCFFPQKKVKFFSHYCFLYLKFSYKELRYPWYSRIKAWENPLKDLAEPRNAKFQEVRFSFVRKESHVTAP